MSDVYRTNEPHAEEIHDLIEIGILIPDTRLQAIADAWRNYHTPIDEQDGRDWFDELAALLDALEGTDDE